MNILPRDTEPLEDSMPADDSVKCSRCHEYKAKTEFNRNARRPNGLQTYCRPCSSEKGREWDKANPEKARAKALRWASQNRDKSRANGALQSAKRRKANPDAVRRAIREWSKAHPEKVKEYTIRWQARNQEKVREYARRAAAKRRVRVRGGFVEDVDIAVVAKRDGYSCGVCGGRVPQREWSLDHILPISKGGGHSYANTRLTHLKCNRLRNNRGAAQLRLTG